MTHPLAPAMNGGPMLVAALLALLAASAPDAGASPVLQPGAAIAAPHQPVVDALGGQSLVQALQAGGQGSAVSLRGLDTQVLPDGQGEADDDADADMGGDDAEAEAGRLVENASDGGYEYSADLADAELERRWVEELPSLGSISVGYAEAGRLINGVQLEPGDGWSVIVPDYAWGTQETIDALSAAARAVHAQHPGASPLRVNHLSKRDGGYLRPHQSHQSGRDADLGFFYKPGIAPGAIRAKREDVLEPAQNFALLKALVTNADVQLVLVDRRVQKVLYDWALAHGEDPAWLERLFHAGRDSLVQHARRHRDHFHVRFYAGRSQELGHRVQPLLARRPAENLLIHRVSKGDTLGRIAGRYGSTVKLIQKANGMTNTTLRIGRTLNVPLRGPCTQCPQPPLVRVPPRVLPPPPKEAALDVEAARGAVGVAALPSSPAPGAAP